MQRIITYINKFIVMSKRIKWNEESISKGSEILGDKDGGMIVGPTKVGYIIMVSDKKGLSRKFTSKNRKLNKPGVVLCSGIEQLKELAEVNDEIIDLYQKHWDQDVLLGCILPWKEEGKKYIPNDGSDELMMDGRGTSCFVIKFGVPSGQIVEKLWNTKKQLVFASSANPSGLGNRGVVDGIGEVIENEADIVIEADDYIKSIQPNDNEETRYEQGVMVSLVDDEGNLVPEQGTNKLVSPAPVIIRKGLDVDKIMNIMSEHFLSWDYRQGAYY